MQMSRLTLDSLPFAQSGRFYRGNLHGHSTNSDGKWNPEEVVRQYRQNGYDFIAITDHFMEQFDFPVTDTRALRKDYFTTLIGAELHHGMVTSGSVWHLLALGLPLEFAPYSDDETIADVVKRARDAGAFVAAAHPSWYTLTVEDFESLGPIHAVECYNAGANLNLDRAYSWHFIETLLNRGHSVGAIAVDDSHMSPGRADFARGWVQVKAPELTPDALLRALKAGHYYSSTGPQIHHIEIVDRDKLTIECSPAIQVLLSGKAAITFHVYRQGLIGAEFELGKLESPWFRLTVLDEYGRRAWTNPVFMT